MPQRPSVPLAVYRNGLLTTELEVIDMQESAGVERLDISHLLYKDLDLEGRAFHSQIVCDEIEVVRTDTNEVLHWGKIGIVPPQLGPHGESLIVVSRTEKFHLGERVNGYFVWSPFAQGWIGPTVVAHELVFNPMIDGKVSGNRNFNHTSNGFRVPGFPLFLNPESVRTTAAEYIQGSTHAVQWKLSECIFYLISTLNMGERYVANPTYAEIQPACDDDEDLVINVHIPRATWLADALDMLLEPLGYRWTVQRTSRGQRKFNFFHRNSGAKVWVRHQPIGDELELGRQNVEVLGITFDVSNLANEITVVGGYFGYEFTIELARGWPALQDDLEEAEYALSSDGFASRKDAWRKWVVNEAGDYSQMRPEIADVFPSADFMAALVNEYGVTIAQDFVPCRRRFEPTLTLKSDGTPIGEHHGIEIEYRNPNYAVGGTEPEWKPIGNWGVEILKHECGIYFNGEFPPLAKIGADDRSNVRIRVTATLVSDKRLQATAARQDDSPQADVVPLVIDAPTKFRHQEVSPLSKYFESGRPSLEAIDTLAIEAFAARVRDVWDLMDVGGAIQLDGLDATDNGVTYQVGQRVQGILGKTVDFSAKNQSDDYPQIIAIERNVLNQTMTLHLQRLRRPITFGGDVVRRGRLGRRER